jgi:hypothetical protein
LSQVATTLYITFDMREVKMVTRATFLQIKLLNDSEFSLILSWGIAAMALSVISIILATPAAIQVRLLVDYKRRTVPISFRSKSKGPYVIEFRSRQKRHLMKVAYNSHAFFPPCRSSLSSNVLNLLSAFI